MKKERYDVVLVQPNITWVYDPIEHLGLAYLAAALRKDGFRVRIVDAVLDRLSPSALYKVCDEFEIGVLGLTLISHGSEQRLSLVTRTRDCASRGKRLGKYARSP